MRFTEEVYFGKAKDVVGDLRSKDPLTTLILRVTLILLIGSASLSEANRDRATHREMISSMSR